MCDNGVIPYNKVFCPSKENKLRIERNENIFYLEDTLDFGFHMKLYHLEYYSGEIVDCSLAVLDSYEDFLCLMDVDTISHNICCKECGQGSFLRNDERRFYHELKKLEKFVDECKDFRETPISEYRVIIIFFKGILLFMRKYKEGFKHKNKKIEKKFNKIGKKMILKFKIQ